LSRLERHGDPPKVTGSSQMSPLLTIMVNSVFNGWRMENVWLDK
jgi:hypothetical protein